MTSNHRVPIRLGSLRTSVRDAPPVSTTTDISVHSAADAPVIRAVAAGRVCRVCTKHESRYSCPRCNVPYCSVDCYRAHGAACTEQFYQAHVSNEMAFDEKATAVVDPKEQRKRATNELLTRVKQFQDETSHAFDEGEDVEVELSAERLAALALMDENELSMDALTPEELATFLADVASGKMSKFVMPWEPWWRMSAAVYEKETANRRRRLIVEVGDAGTIEINGEPENTVTAIEPSRFPAAVFTADMDDATPHSLDALVRAPVSPSLAFHLVEILFAYAITMRIFNGDWQQTPGEAAASILQYSAVLASDARFATLEEAALQCLEQRDGDGVHHAATNRLALSDAADLLSHRVFVLDAVTDLQQLMGVAVSQCQRHKDRQRLRKVAKKLEFFQLWQSRSSDDSTTPSSAQLHSLLDHVTQH